MNRWKFWGQLESGESVYCTREGDIAIEKDHRNLTYPTPREKREIYRRWPGLIDKPIPINLRPKKNPEIEVIELTGDIAKMEIDAMERKSTIAALKYANDEKEKMILSFMKDVENFKVERKILWKEIELSRETIKAKEGAFRELEEQIKSGRHSKKE